MDYVVCIPSYKRASLCKEKTLSMLKKNGISKGKIYVYVANKEEYEEYLTILEPDSYNKLIIGKKGLVNQRQFIMNSWKEGKPIVFLDDDISSVDLSMSSLFRKHNLEYFFQFAFKECKKTGAFLWGVYAVFNPFFRKAKKEMSSTELNFIVGAFYGIINRPKLNSIRLNITTKENDQKEDVERTIKYFIQDRVVLRFNRVGFLTKYYGNQGGMGNFESRIANSRGSSERLNKAYPTFGRIRVRKSGVYEFVLQKNPFKEEEERAGGGGVPSNANARTKKSPGGKTNTNRFTRKKRNKH